MLPPPKYIAAMTAMTSFFDQLEIIDSTKYSHVLLLGDFNFPEINWDDGTLKVYDVHSVSIFFEMMQDLALY